ncbi:MAG: hypothetical protein AAFP85_07005 [Pseudomonadota bacterium]
MRQLPTLEKVGYELDSAEERHRENPETFYLPPKAERESLQTDDLAKLIFDISIDDDVAQLATERMWVKVIDSKDGIYSGTLENKPYCREEGKIRLALGDTVLFSPEHIIMTYTAAELTQKTEQRKNIIETITIDQAIEVQKRCKDRKMVDEMVSAGFPVFEVLEKYNLDLPTLDD